jgi:putative membrane protein
MNVYFANWAPVAVAALLGTGLLWTDRFDFDVFGPARGVADR